MFIPVRFAGWLKRVTPLLVLFAAGCASYPMGLTKEQWEALPASQQAEYQARQTELDEQRRAREEVERARREAEERERLAIEEERIAARHRHARYGDVITVSVQDGMIAFSGKRHPYETVAFNLVRGETKEVEFVRQGKSHYRTNVTMRFSEDGNTFYFDVPSGRRFVAIGDEWETGKEYHPPEIRGSDGPSEAIGVTIRIHYRRVSGKHHDRR